MSLFDYLNNDPLGSSSGSLANAQMTQIIQQAIAKQGGTASSTASGLGTAQQSVLITLDAQRASASAADSSKDAISLAAELRAAMDKHYEGQGNRTPAVSAFSARALSIVALNENGGFSKAEIAAAKAELRARDRASALTLINSGELTAASLQSYSRQLLAAREAMSREERTLRDGNPDLR